MEIWLFIGTLAIGAMWLIVGPTLLYLSDRGLTRVAGRAAGLPAEEVERQLAEDGQ